jgi:hypothetical protein
MGIRNVLGHDGSQINIELAKDHKRIAEETKRDSTSMTVIAVATMFFLPGTFTAVRAAPHRQTRPVWLVACMLYLTDTSAQQGFFALPYFARDTEAHGYKQFWIYWVVTISLTILTSLIWLLYTKVLNPVIPRSRHSTLEPQIEEQDIKEHI